MKNRLQRFNNNNGTRVDSNGVSDVDYSKRSLRPKPKKRYHVVNDDNDDNDDVNNFIDVQQTTIDSNGTNNDIGFDPFDENSEQMREFRKLVDDYLKC